jgi:opine dehydrogenase
MPPRSLEEIAIIGAGHGGHAMAAHLSLGGFSVRFCEMPEFADNLRPAQERGGIELTGRLGEGFASLQQITADPAAAIRGASHIFVVTQALGHARVAELCAPYLEAGQSIILFPGSGGSLQFARVLQDRGVTHKVYLAETVTLPYTCRLRGPAQVTINNGPAVHEPIAAFPACDNQAVIETARAAYPTLTPASHVLEIALYNPNILLHPVGVLFNLGRIEYTHGEFWMYREGFTPSVLKVLHALDAEKMSLLRALGVDPMHHEGSYEYRYQSKWADFAATSSKGPSNANTRYITEDVPIGMVLWASLGRLLGVPTPTALSLIHISSVIHGRDYWQEGRTVEKLGLAGMTGHELVHYLLQGSTGHPLA